MFALCVIFRCFGGLETAEIGPSAFCRRAAAAAAAAAAAFAPLWAFDSPIQSIIKRLIDSTYSDCCCAFCAVLGAWKRLKWADHVLPQPARLAAAALFVLVQGFGSPTQTVICIPFIVRTLIAVCAFLHHSGGLETAEMISFTFCRVCRRHRE
jgi:hypothetical protein